MIIFRLTWLQRNQLHCQDYRTESAANDALLILTTRFGTAQPHNQRRVKEARVERLEVKEPDFSGPRPLTGDGGKTGFNRRPNRLVC
jgi:hypothetical protein